MILADILFCLNTDAAATITLLHNNIYLYRQLSLVAQQVIEIDPIWRHFSFKISLDCRQPIVVNIVVFEVCISINRHFIFPC